jgi:chemotaxis signal transduction protein
VSEGIAFLVVRAGERDIGLRLEDVVEVADLGDVHPVPSTAPALRGITPSRGGLMPVVHLGALLAGVACPATRGRTVVRATMGGWAVGLEVEDADLLTRQEPLPVPPGESLPWALAMVRGPAGLIPILNLEAFRDRLLETGAKA